MGPALALHYINSKWCRCLEGRCRALENIDRSRNPTRHLQVLSVVPGSLGFRLKGIQFAATTSFDPTMLQFGTALRQNTLKRPDAVHEL